MQGERKRATQLVTLLIGRATLAASVLMVAGVFAPRALSESKTIDRTVSCPIPVQGGIPVFGVGASVGGFKTHFGSGGVTTVSYTRPVIWFQNSRKSWDNGPDLRSGWYVDYESCHAVPRIPLSHEGLKLDGVARSTRNGLGDGPDKRCWSASTATFRIRVALGKSGLPVAVRLAVRSGKKLAPLSYVDWTPTRVTSYFASDCFDR